MKFDPVAGLQEELRRAPPQTGPTWLLTFTDVTALMLTFFVMIFAMSTIPSEKWDEVVSILSTRDRDSQTGEPVARAPRNVATTSEKPALALSYLSRLLKEHLADVPALAGARVSELDGALAISFPLTEQFAAGRARPEPGFAAALEQVAGVLNRFGNRIDVVGHAAPAGTDAPAEETGGAIGAWRLSLARAQAVAAALGEAGYGPPVRVVARGAGTFDRLAPQAPSQRREALARRVDIVIHDRAGG